MGISITAASLVLVSAFLHAGWNLLGKSRTPTPAFFCIATLSVGLFLLPLSFCVLAQAQSLPRSFWLLLLSSGFFQMIYMGGLSLAYQRANMGLVYPIARALPVLLVALATVLLGQSLPLLAWLGMLLVTIGCLLVPLVYFRECHWRAYWRADCAWALVAAIGTVGYSLADKGALLYLGSAVGKAVSPMVMVYSYLGMQFLACGLWLLLGCFGQSGTAQLIQSLKDLKVVALTGAMMGATYGLVLLAMTMTENVSYVVALRQLSIPLGVGLAIWLLNEPAHRPQLLGVGLVCAGLIAVSLH
ncbi:EamA family transporter [Microbulbifer sp. OS29]|uniref:EamA family transporter n=1 Tax=Microbulbifer okhotskensis TaxID=2926617 RepID=A0A9X2J681_9GAMM|nr:EamA family transporter [Microbulbifer okhotskensis]MCO1333196.1 EamA family transporter [Microbulbifer okhotskensis]